MKKSSADWLVIGETLLAGRRLCMKAVGADKPRGIRYVQANSQWLLDTGFTEIYHATRTAAMSVAENIGAVREWLAQLPEDRRLYEHPCPLWKAYRAATRPKRELVPELEPIQPISLAGPDLETLRQAQIDAISAARAVVRKARLAVSDILASTAAKALEQEAGEKVEGSLVEKISDACFCAVLNSLDIAIPDEIFRRQNRCQQIL